jgi:hypothetical protein
VVSCAKAGKRDSSSSQFTNGPDLDGSTSGNDDATSSADVAIPTSDDGGQTIRTGDGGGCVPQTCAGMGYDCGVESDHCGNLLRCGTCPAGQTCGFGGRSRCGWTLVGQDGGGSGDASPCVAATCASLGVNCGPQGDGCGGMLQCGTCSGSDICGGGGMPGVCGVPCTNLCMQQVACDSGLPTTVTGTVLAGVSAWTNLPPDPVPNVLVYVPNSALQPFATGTACRLCGSDVSGDPLVSTYTDFDGTFTLSNVPAGMNIPIVIQLGRWRRQLMVNVPSCTTTALGGLNMPRNAGEGNIPLTAVSTGNVDALECVLLKMGVDRAEFTPDSGMGRIHMYGGGPGNNNGTPGAIAGPGTRAEPALLDTGGTFMNYDQIMLPCWGAPATKTVGELANLITYADMGGHFFATHYSYSWLINNGEFNNVAQWNPDYHRPTNGGIGPWTFNVSTGVPPAPPAPRNGTFAKWLNHVGALSNPGVTVPPNPQVSISSPRHDANVVAGGSVSWIDGTDPDKNNPMVEHFTFNAPVGAVKQCGHAIFSDFHVADSVTNNGKLFPSECTTTFTAQEKILEFMIWDLSSCVNPPTPPICRPHSCGDQHVGCGPAGDGCGQLLDCGPCTPPATCGGGGVRSQCGYFEAGSCPPITCASQGIACGPAGDGCGNLLQCGTCTPPQTCGGGGVQGQCGGIR